MVTGAGWNASSCRCRAICLQCALAPSSATLFVAQPPPTVPTATPSTASNTMRPWAPSHPTAPRSSLQPPGPLRHRALMGRSIAHLSPLAAFPTASPAVRPVCLSARSQLTSIPLDAWFDVMLLATKAYRSQRWRLHLTAALGPGQNWARGTLCSTRFCR
jgi:hypothetical protein